jgi:hypothetical protein
VSAAKNAGGEMSAVAAVSMTRSNAPPKVVSPSPVVQTRNAPNSGAMMNVATPAVTLTPATGNAVQASASLTATPIPVAPERGAGIQAVLDKFADWSNNIPGFRMLTIVLGFNPINFRAASRNASNLLRALIELVPGGAVITQALDNHGAINQAGSWVAQQIAGLGEIGGDILRGLNRFLDSLGTSDLIPWNWGNVWERAKQIFTAPIARLISFGASAATDILKMVKQVILKPLAALAKDTKGYDLLKAILGEDPITGELVPRNAETLIGGFMKFIDQEEIWQNIKKGNAVARAWTWFQGALKDLMGMVRAVPKQIVATLSSLTFQDIITLGGAFMKVVTVFANTAGDFLIWGLKTSWNLLEIIFDVVKPGIMVYIKKTGAALKSIIKNPLPFVGNLVKAAKLGFQNFADRFGGHLKAGLIDWLTGSLTGVYLPTALSLPEMGKFAMSVLGITWTQIRGKIVKALGPTGETIMKGLETGFDIVVALVKGGPAAAWELIKEKLTELKDQVVGGIVSFVKDTVISKAVPKLISMFIPGAGFISAIVSIYDTVMVFVDKIAKIIEVVTAFIDSIVTIAAGNITAAANRVEKILGGLLSLAISFLAGFLGLGKITDKIMGVIEKVRTKVDAALDKAVEWVVEKAKTLFGKVKGAVTDWWNGKEKFTADGETHHVLVEGGAENAKVIIASTPTPYSVYLNAMKKSPDRDQAIKLAKEIEDKPKQTNTALEAEEKRKKLNELALLLGKLTNDQEVPLSQIHYDDVNTLGGGMKMTAKPLTRKHPAGYDVSDSPPIYEELGILRHTQGPPNYVQGHLLNNKLGGPGVRFNLTPLTNSANGNHRSKVEEKVKKWLENTKVKAVYYEVVVGVYGQHDPSNPVRLDKLEKREAAGQLSPNEATELSARRAEIRLAGNIVCNAYVLESDSNGVWDAAKKPPSGLDSHPIKNEKITNV